MIVVALCGLFWLFPAAARAQAPYTVCLQPLGEHESDLLDPIGRGIGQVYGFGVRTLPPRALPKAAWYSPRGRYRAERILDALRVDVRPKSRGCDVVLGFTAVDVSTSKGAHADWGVLGLSYTGAGVSVVSTFRMHRDADRALVQRRAVKVVLHELGHAIGLPHRSEGPECLMNDAHGAIASIDRARGTLCPGERAAAEALLHRKLPPQK